MSTDHRTQKDFASAANEPATGFLMEFWYFLRFNRKWWLTPIIVVLLVIAVLVVFGATGAAPLIYTLF